MQYDFPLLDHGGFLRSDLAVVGGFYNNLQQAGTPAGDYTTLNLAAGMQLYRWEVQLFLHNVTDTDAANWISQFAEYSSAYLLRPRTIGMSLRYAFTEVN